MFDTVTSSLSSRFHTDSNTHMIRVEQFLVTHHSSDNVSEILKFYGNNIDADRLLLHRDMLFDIMQSKHVVASCLSDIVTFLRDNPNVRVLLPELVKLVRIVLTVPVTSCTAERSFSSLRRLKSYMRSTMKQSRLNSVAVTNVHNDILHGLDLDVIANEFISRSQIRQSTFSTKSIKN